MIKELFLLTGMIAAQAGDVAPEADDIVVVARKQGCDVEQANRVLSDREFDLRAREWARGKPVRVFARADADVKCLAKIAFRLGDRGVKRIEYVDPAGRPARPLMANQSMSATPQTDIGDRERRFFAKQAAKLILEGKCAEARRLALENGDLDAAADVVQICRAP